MQAIRISNSAYQYLKEEAKTKKESLIDTMDFILEVFKQVVSNTTFNPSKQGTYPNYKYAFYEQNKHLLPEHERRFFESSKERMKKYWKEHKAELNIFKIACLQKKEK